MNIGLMGVPGSGKSTLAQRLSNSLSTEDTGCGCTVYPAIVDRYIPEIEQRTRIAMGPSTSYLGNLYVALERYTRERVARLDHEVVITCGTLVETAVYMAMQFVALQSVLDEVAKEEAAPRIDAAVRILAVLYNDCASYDYAFYLPVGEDAPEDIKYFDQQLKAGVEGFKLAPVTILNDPDTRLEDALAAMENGQKSE